MVIAVKLVMKTFKIDNKYIILDIVTTLLPIILVLVLSLVSNINATAIIAIFISCIIMLCYPFYTLIKCYRFDKHTQMTILDNNVCYTNQLINIEFDIDDISECWYYTSSRVGHGYSVLKLKNQRCIYITDLIDQTEIDRLCKSRKIAIHHGTDVFLLGLASNRVLSM